jgi:quercetin dioxygenase-like cupin family protein
MMESILSLSELNDELEGQFQCDLSTVHHFSDGLYAKEMHIPKGFVAGTHAHSFSHLSMLAKGRVKVTTDDYNCEYIAPACIEIKAGIHHMIEALEDAVWFCIHATDETDPEKVDKVLIERK